MSKAPAAPRISEMCLSFVEFEMLPDALRAFTAPAIPFRFLIDSGLFQLEFRSSVNGMGTCRTPWYNGYGRLFWARYIEKPSPTTQDLWDSLVPFAYPVVAPISAAWLKGSAKAHAYLFPWGIGAFVDVTIKEDMTLTQAVQKAVDIRAVNQADIDLDGVRQQLPLLKLLAALRGSVRNTSFGPATQAGSVSDLFSVVTVLDAQPVNLDEPVAEKSSLHRALNGLARLTQNWKSVKLEKLEDNVIGSQPGVDANLLFGTRRGRAVWLPGSFASTDPLYKNKLRCYHRNLTMASLQTEALCLLAKSAEPTFANGASHSSLAPNYDRCLRNAAGILGRLAGGQKAGIYGSRSIQAQIKKTYEMPVNTLRSGYGMTALT